MIAAAAGGGGAPASWLDLIPGFDSVRDSLSSALGETWVEGDPVKVAHVFLTVLVIGAVFFLAVRAKSKFEATADSKLTLRTAFELVFDGLMGMMEAQMGRKNAERFFPLIGTLAIFIFFCNVLTLLPGGLPPTQFLNTTAAPALVVFVVTHWVGVKEHGFGHYAAHFLGPVRKWYALPLMVLMLLIEIIGHLARPLSLSLRLMGNMFGDHTVLAKFLGMFPFILPIPNMVLGTVVVIVQTMVFCILSIVYIALALAHEDEAH